MWTHSYAICSAPTDDALTKEIPKRIEEFKQQQPSAMVVSVSHDVMTTGKGAFLWTALITLEYNDGEVRQTHLYDQEADNANQDSTNQE